MKRRAVALACVLAAVGCDSVSSDSIQRWKTTQKGPTKLQEAVRSSGVAPRLRAEAAAALVDIGMVEEAESAIGSAPSVERAEIVKTLIPIYGEGMKNPDLAKARTARDALFGVRQFAGGPEEQRAIDGAILPSLERDLREGRTASGRHSMEKMLAAAGPAAGPMLVKLLEDPKVPYAGVVDLLQRVADDASRQAGAVALVKRASSMQDIPVPVWRALGTL